jgi:hypothetical protein
MSFFTESILAPAQRPRESAGTGSPRQLRVMAVLTAIFNVMSLNAVLVITCLPLITAPAALQSAAFALERWRSDGDDRVVRQFITALRSLPFRHTTASVGVPMVAAVVAVEEMLFFSRGAATTGALGLGLGFCGLVVALAGCGYALLLGVRDPELSATDTWYLAIVLVMRNLLRATPLLAMEGGAAVLIALRDPSLTVIGLPLGLLALVRVTAAPAVDRVLAQIAQIESRNDPEVTEQ